MKNKAVIFDMDGVIIDSEPIHHKVSIELFERLDINITEDEYDNFLGKAITDKWDYLINKHNLNKTVQELSEIELNNNIQYLAENKISSMDGLKQLLNNLKNIGFKIGLASSSSYSYISIILKKLSIKDYFFKVLSGEDFKNGKPSPDIYNKMAEHLKIEPRRCVVIEDSENGIKAAKDAGMFCIGLDYSEFGNQNLSNSDLIVSSLKEINIKLINNLIN